MQFLNCDRKTTKRGKRSAGTSRRRLLQGATVVGAVAIGVGSASANGKGGQGVIAEDQFCPDCSFTIHEVPEERCSSLTADGSCRDEPLLFQCRGEGTRIPFPWWYLEYTSGPLAGTLVRFYTRDNSISTEATYRWTRQKKSCPNTPGYYQVGFAGTPDQ